MAMRGGEGREPAYRCSDVAALVRTSRKNKCCSPWILRKRLLDRGDRCKAVLREFDVGLVRLAEGPQHGFWCRVGEGEGHCGALRPHGSVRVSGLPLDIEGAASQMRAPRVHPPLQRSSASS